MKTLLLPFNAAVPVTLTVKADVRLKVILFAAILTCINLVAFM